MGLSEKYKRKLNVLIPYYRKQFINETKDGKWQQTAFYTDDNTKLPFCSSAIYSGLENQKVIVRDEVYEFAAKKLHKSCVEDNEIEKSFEHVVDKIYHLMEFKEETECIKVLEKVLPVLNEVCKGILVYGEYLWFLNLLHNFFVSRDNIITEIEFLKLDVISNIYDGKLYDLVICYLFIYANFKEDGKVTYVLNKYDYEKSDFVSNRLYIFHKYIADNEFIKAMTYGQKLIEDMIKTKNLKRLPTLYVEMSILLQNFDTIESMHFLNRAISLITKLDIEKNQLFVLYLNIGALYLAKENYELCVHYHELALTISKTTKVRCYTCICHSYHMMNKEIPATYLRCDEFELGDSIDRSAYYFFFSYNKQTAQENIKYIMKRVLPLLEKKGWVYTTMFESELRILCKSIRGYKSLHEYQEYINKK